MNDLQKLFLDELTDIYDAEKQLINALPKMAGRASSDELRQAFEMHLEQTKKHKERLEQVFHSLDESAHRKHCKGMEGLIAEGAEMAEEFAGNSALDAALICAAQKVEHYEITAYGCLCTWAKELGMDEQFDLLQQNLREEKETDEQLTELAEQSRNLEAMET